MTSIIQTKHVKWEIKDKNFFRYFFPKNIRNLKFLYSLVFSYDSFVSEKIEKKLLLSTILQSFKKKNFSIEIKTRKYNKKSDLLKSMASFFFFWAFNFYRLKPEDLLWNNFKTSQNKLYLFLLEKNFSPLFLEKILSTTYRCNKKENFFNFKKSVLYENFFTKYILSFLISKISGPFKIKKNFTSFNSVYFLKNKIQMIQFLSFNKFFKMTKLYFLKEEKKLTGVFSIFLVDLFFLKKKIFKEKKIYTLNRHKIFSPEGGIIYCTCQLNSTSFFWETRQLQKIDLGVIVLDKFCFFCDFSFVWAGIKKKIQNFEKVKILKNFLFWKNLWKKLLFFYKRKLILNENKIFISETLGVNLRDKAKILFPLKFGKKNSPANSLKQEVASKIKYIIEKHSGKKILWIRILSLEKIQNNIDQIKKIIGMWVQKDFLSKNLECVELCLNFFEILSGNPGKIKFAFVNRKNKELESIFQSLFKKVPIEIEKILTLPIWNKNFFFNLEFLKITSLVSFSDLARKLFQKSLLYSYGGPYHDSMLMQCSWLECKNGSIGLSCKIEFSLKKKTYKTYPTPRFLFSKMKKHKKWKGLFFILKELYKTPSLGNFLEELDEEFFTETSEKKKNTPYLKKHFLSSTVF